MTVPKVPPAGVFFALFTLSGFAGLIYQSIWSHYLKLFLGHAAYAQTLVLMIFMGGMAIGSWFAARYANKWQNLLLAYAIVEGCDERELTGIEENAWQTAHGYAGILRDIRDTVASVR